MKFEELRTQVWGANLELASSGLVTGTFGNVSGVDRAAGVFAIKPSGVPYEDLDPEDIVVIEIESGDVVDGELRPSSDTPTHLELYRRLDCGGIAHTHSEYATILAQARLPLRCMGTTHADSFHGDVPVTRELTEAEVNSDYELNTGRVIVEAFADAAQAGEVAAVLVANHGPFTWGRDPSEAVERSRMLEDLARMECMVRIIAPSAQPPAHHLIQKHFLRKHGKDAYYGQSQ